MKKVNNKTNLLHTIFDLLLIIISLVIAVYQLLEIHNIIALLMVVWVIIRGTDLKIFSSVAILAFFVATLFLFVKRPDAANSAAIIGFYALVISMLAILFNQKEQSYDKN
ncbi:MAG: hypothetical protein PHH24_04455 [Candidatus Moranbacteria bacterium]|jgi:hypothetical protein|nr:hypothetical protein [Candidatus Moranbacteria bacterium]